MIVKASPPRFQVGDQVRCAFTYEKPFNGVIVAEGYSDGQWRVARDGDGKRELIHEGFMTRIGRPDKV